MICVWRIYFCWFDQPVRSMGAVYF